MGVGRFPTCGKHYEIVVNESVGTQVGIPGASVGARWSENLGRNNYGVFGENLLYESLISFRANISQERNVCYTFLDV